MDILSLLKNLLSETDAEKIAPLINLLRENSFDIKKVLKNLKPETVLPIVKSFLNNENAYAKGNVAENSAGISAVANVADKEIVYCLNRYLSAERSV